jgi:hypothetical protein
VVKLIHIYLNFRFYINVIFTVNYSFSESRRSRRQQVVLVINFMNLKIKSTQSFRCNHRDRVYVLMFIGMSNHEYLCLYCVSKKT